MNTTGVLPLSFARSTCCASRSVIEAMWFLRGGTPERVVACVQVEARPV
jgi:hypothetical protein